MATANDVLCCPEFIELQRRLNRFNVFEATDMGRREIKHTKFLAYLLDPNESHGLGDTFLNHFLIFLMSASDNFGIGIINLNTGFSKVSTELSSRDGETNERIDLVIEIPFLSKEVSVVIAIENKIGAKQGADQLSGYSDILKKHFPHEEGREKYHLKKYFLTEQGEEPGAADWVGVQYSNTIIPAIKETLQSHKGRMSEYIEYTLNDYLDLLDFDENSNEELEKLARKISNNNGIINYIKNGDNGDLELQNLKLKYSKACSYMTNFDADVRKQILGWFGKLESQEINTNRTRLKFNVESSNRNLLRFSILSEENQAKTANLSKNLPNRWLDSERCIAFEIGMTPVKINDEENPANDPSPFKLKAWATLVLGPTNLDTESRNILANSIRRKINQDQQEGQQEDQRVSDRFSRLTKPSIWTESKATVIECMEMNQLEEKFKEWISTNLFKFNGGTFSLKEKLSDIAIKLNQALDDYPPSIDAPQP